MGKVTISIPPDKTHAEEVQRKNSDAHPDLLLRLLLTHAHKLEERRQLLCHPNTRRARSEEQDPVVLEWETGRFRGESGGVEETAEDDSAGALDLSKDRRMYQVVRLHVARHTILIWNTAGGREGYVDG